MTVPPTHAKMAARAPMESTVTPARVWQDTRGTIVKPVSSKLNALLK